MAATFDPNLGSERDFVRFSLGDTDMENPLLPDETYDALYSSLGDWKAVGASAADALISRFAQEPDSVSISGEISVSWRSRIAAWTALAARWRAEINQGLAAIVSSAAERDSDDIGEYVVYSWETNRYGR